MGQRACWAGIAVACALLLLPGAAGAAFPGQNGKIAFQQGGAIYTIDPDGSGLSQLIANGEEPAWSADGTRLAYIDRRAGRGSNGLYTASADGSGQTLVRAHVIFSDEQSFHSDTWSEPAWAPDGELIAYESMHLGCAVHAGCLEWSEGVRAIRPDGSGDHQLLDPWAADPAYSPDGTRIAWEDHWMVSPRDVHVSDADGTGDTVLTQGPDLPGGFDPSWSPDGSRLAYTFPAASGNDIWVVNVDGTGHEPLIGMPGEDTNPIWSPDGSRIVWVHERELWIANADGSGRQRLTPEGTFAASPDWQPLAGPRREDFRNASHFCKALRAFVGEQEFAREYRNHGGCVSRNR
jgi:Tol biopolymer transport system component